jgi:hypothetical protein
LDQVLWGKIVKVGAGYIPKINSMAVKDIQYILQYTQGKASQLKDKKEIE